MISVIVCSVNREARPAFTAQIERTIGTEHELCWIKNDEERLSICAAYNKAASIAKYPFLCFAHEDLSFHTKDWGIELAKQLGEKKEIGWLGMAGATLKTRNPSPWWITHDNPLAQKYRRAHYIQAGIEQMLRADKEQEAEPLLEEVICLDGFFLACTRETWSQTPFDEQTLRNFHFYDLDSCLSAREKGQKNYVYSGCRIEHHSAGSINKGWIESAEAFHRKWRRRLPDSLEKPPAGELRELERLALIDYINALIKNGYRAKALKYIIRLAGGYKKYPQTARIFKAYLRSLSHA